MVMIRKLDTFIMKVRERPRKGEREILVRINLRSREGMTGNDI